MAERGFKYKSLCALSGLWSGLIYRLEEEKAQRRGQKFDRQTATYVMDRCYDDIYGFDNVEAGFPAIVFNSPLASEPDLLCEPTINILALSDRHLAYQTSPQLTGYTALEKRSISAMSSLDEPISSGELPLHDSHSILASLPDSPYRGYPFHWYADNDHHDDHHDNHQDDHDIVQAEIQIEIAPIHVPNEPTEDVLGLADVEPIPESPLLSPGYVAAFDLADEPIKYSDRKAEEAADYPASPITLPIPSPVHTIDEERFEPFEDDEPALAAASTPAPHTTIFFYVGRRTTRMSVRPVPTPLSAKVEADITAFATSLPPPLPTTPPPSPLS
ncbi:hypothetical protein Tco_1465543 [Tanacetum coccineum]